MSNDLSKTPDECVDYKARPRGPLCPPRPGSAPSAIRPVLVNLADVQPEKVEWLWADRIALGKVTLLVGAPGGGKSFVTIDAAARVTVGRTWPDGTPCPRGGVVLVNAEDGHADTIRPRFDACGGDPRRVTLVDGVHHAGAGGQTIERGLTLADVSVIAAAIDATPDCRLLVIDPIGSFLGGRVDAHRDNDVRSVLMPLVKLARDKNIAVLLVAHTRKGGGGGADERALGSRAFVGVARAVHHLIFDAQNPRRRLFLPGKNNLADEGNGLAFTVTGDPPAVAWEADPVRMTADEGYAAADRASADEEVRRGPAPVKHDAATAFLVGILQNGPVAVKQLQADTKAAGLAWRTVRRAADELDVKRKKANFGSGWEWRLPRDGNGRPIVPASPRLADSPSTLPLGHLDTFTLSGQKPKVPGTRTGEGNQVAQQQHAGAEDNVDTFEGQEEKLDHLDTFEKTTGNTQVSDSLTLEDGQAPSVGSDHAADAPPAAGATLDLSNGQRRDRWVLADRREGGER